MSSTFTPSNVVDMSKERDWPANLGMLDWDSTSIVFTKRSLIEFLKYTGTTVDTNFSNIAKLPRYAKFGKLTSVSEECNNQENPSDSVHTVSDGPSPFKHDNKARTAPEGTTHDIFGHDEGEDALSSAPHQINKPGREIAANNVIELALPLDAQDNVGDSSSNFKPSRRVRTQPGGQSSLSNLWGADTQSPNKDFKPTRRVREGPGGEDHMHNIF